MKHSKLKKTLALLSVTSLLFANMQTYSTDTAKVSAATNPSSISVNSQKVTNKQHYNGTDSDAYGYGGITNPITYLENRYGGVVKFKRSRCLNINNDSMSTVSGKSANNCSLVAISKVLEYLKTSKTPNIPDSIQNIYKDVEKVGKKYGYTDKKGTDFWDIYDISRDVIKNYGYTPKCDTYYIWSFDTVVNEMSDWTPLILNISSGYYENHSVTVVGYNIYTIGNREYPMLRVSDGWHSNKYRYIDFNDFEWSSLGSFNVARIK